MPHEEKWKLELSWPQWGGAALGREMQRLESHFRLVVEEVSGALMVGGWGMEGKGEG